MRAFTLVLAAVRRFVSRRSRTSKDVRCDGCRETTVNATARAMFSSDWKTG